MKKHNRLLLSPIALAVMAALSPAFAQQAAEPAKPPEKKADTTEKIEVHGFRASLESALNEKRESNAIVDVIKQEDIAKFPDTNLAESLQRVPGVVVDRDAGEGRNITVRGLGADFTRVRINGVEALATTGGTDSSGGNNRSRGFDFNVFASELFSTITVRKSSQADVDEGSLGATVDLQTARPFDYTGFQATASLQARYNDLAREVDPRGAFLLSNTWYDRKVGFLISGAYSKRQLFEEGFSTVRWDNGASSGGWCSPIGVTPANPATTATTCGPTAQGVGRLPNTPGAIAAYDAARDPANFHPRLPRYGRLTHDQDRTGITAAFQVKPSQSSLVTIDLLYSKLKATRQEDFLEAISFSRNAGQGGKPQTSVVETQYGPNGELLYGLYNGVDVRAESRYDELETTFKQPTLTYEQDIGDWVKFTGKLGRADSKFRNPYQTTTTLDAINVNGYGIDLRDSNRLPRISYPFDVTQPGGALTLVSVPRVTSGTQPATVPNTTTSEIRIRPQGSDNVNDVANADLAWEMVPGKFTAKGGVDYKKVSFETFEFRRVNQNDTIFAPPTGTSINDLTTTISGFGRGPQLAFRHADLLGHPEPASHHGRVQHLLQLPAVRPSRRPRRLHAVVHQQRQRPRQQPLGRGDQHGRVPDGGLLDQPVRPAHARQLRRALREDEADGHGLAGDGRRHGSDGGERVRRLAALGQPGHQREPRLHRAPGGGQGDGAAAARQPEPRRHHQHDRQPHHLERQPAARALPRQDPGRELRMVFRPQLAPRPGSLLQGHRHLHPEPAHQRPLQPDGPAGLAPAAELHRGRGVPGDGAGQHERRRPDRLRDQLPAGLHHAAGGLQEFRHAAELHVREVEDRVPDRADRRDHDQRRLAQPVAEVVERDALLRRRALQRAGHGIVPRGIPHPCPGAEQQRRRGQEQHDEHRCLDVVQDQQEHRAHPGRREPHQRARRPVHRSFPATAPWSTT